MGTRRAKGVCLCALRRRRNELNVLREMTRPALSLTVLPARRRLERKGRHAPEEQFAYDSISIRSKSAPRFSLFLSIVCESCARSGRLYFSSVSLIVYIVGITREAVCVDSKKGGGGD